MAGLDSAVGDEPLELKDVLDATSALGDKLSQLADGQTLDGTGLLQELADAQHELQLVADRMQPEYGSISSILERRGTDRWWQRKLMATLPMPMLETDTNGRIVWANSSAATALSRQTHHLVRTMIQRVVHTDDHRTVDELLASVQSLDPDADPDAERRVESVIRLPAEIGGMVSVELVRVASPGDERALVTWVLNPVPDGPGVADSVVARTFSELCLLPLRSGSLQDLLSEVARLGENVCAVRSSVSVCIGPPVEPSHLASSTEFAQLVDAAQMTANDGPCEHAWETDTIVYSNDVVDDSRWPSFGAAAADTGIASALAAPIRVGDDLLGVLNVYSRELNAFEPDGMRVIELLADAAGAIIHHVGQETHLRELTVQLEEAMTSREVIEQAKGVLMAQYGCSAEEAFSRLAQVSQDRNIKVREIATALIASVTNEQLG